MTKAVRGDGPAKPKAPAKERTGSEGGRPRRIFTKEERVRIAHYAEIGTPQEIIAKVMNCCVETLVDNCREELDRTLEVSIERVGLTLYEKALSGCTTSMIWFEKTRAGRREIQAHEHSGKDGGPIEYRNLTDEEVDARIAALLGSSSTGEAAA